MKKYISIVAALSILLLSCDEEPLDRTIFIPDEDNRQLPAYTEWGYNSFGATYEREIFISTNQIVPCKIVYNNGILDFALIGQLNWDNTVLTFSFPLSEEIKNIGDLAVLHDLSLDLSKNCTVKLEANNAQTTFEVLSGKLYFRRFQLLRVDGEVNRIILSGTFNVKFLKNGRPETILDGRFDMGITEKDFYSYTN